MEAYQIEKWISENKLLGDDINIKGKVYCKIPFEEFKEVPYIRNYQERWNFIRLNYLRDTESVLDIGCANGTFCFLFVQEGFNKIQGIDIDNKQLELCIKLKEMFFKEKCQFEFSDVSITQNPEQYDIILFLSTFQWLVYKFGLNFSKKILKDLLYECRQMFFETAGSDSRAPLPEADNKKWIENLLKECGFIIVNSKEVDCESSGKKRWIFNCVTHPADYYFLKNIRVFDDAKQSKVFLIEKDCNMHGKDKYVIKDYRKGIYNNEAEILSLFYNACEYFPEICTPDLNSDDIVMIEYIEGKQLEEVKLLNKEQIEQLKDILRILKENNIQHRDIKPNNIIITPEGDIRLIDFGWASAPEYPLKYPIPKELNCNYSIDDEKAVEMIIKEFGEKNE